jgi:DNA-binding XRE family transcriptional regulator
MSDLQNYLDRALPKCVIGENRSDSIYEKIADEIIKIRLERNLTQKDLAELCNIQQSNISRLENATYNPSVQLLEKIAIATGKELVISFV